MTEELRGHPGVMALSEHGCRWAGSLLASRLIFILKMKGTWKITSWRSNINRFVLDHSNRPRGARA